MADLISVFIFLAFFYLVLVRRVIDVYMFAACGIFFYYGGMLLLGYTLDVNEAGRLVLNSKQEVSRQLIMYIFGTLFLLCYFSFIDYFFKGGSVSRSLIKPLLHNYVMFGVAMVLIFVLMAIVIYKIEGDIFMSKIGINAAAGAYVTIFVYLYAVAIFSYAVVRCEISRKKRFAIDLGVFILTIFGLFVLDHKMGMLVPLLSLLIGRVLHKRLNMKDMLRVGFVSFLVSILVLFKYLSSADLNLYGVLAELEGYFTASLGNFLISSNHYNGASYLLFSPFFALPVLRSLSGYSSSYFNETFQPVYFKDADFGMAYNFYAELESTGIGALVLFVFCFLFFIGNILSKKTTGFLRFSSIYLMFYCVFFLHRQSIFVLISILSNYMAICLFVFLVSWFFAKLVRVGGDK